MYLPNDKLLLKIKKVIEEIVSCNLKKKLVRRYMNWDKVMETKWSFKETGKGMVRTQF